MALGMIGPLSFLVSFVDSALYATFGTRCWEMRVLYFWTSEWKLYYGEPEYS